MFSPSNKRTMSMWRLLTVLVTLAVPLVVATVPESGLVAIAAQQVTTIMPHDLQPVPNPQLSTGERLAQLHKALASPGDPHDVILEIGAIGDATSVRRNRGRCRAKDCTPPLTLVFTCWTPSNQSPITMQEVTPKTGGCGTKRTKVSRKRNGSKMGSSNTGFLPPTLRTTRSSRS